MKKSLKYILAATLLIGSISLKAQSTLKIGHIDSQALIMAMPESDSASKKLEASRKQIQETLESLQVEFNQKYQTYIDKQNTYTELIRSAKETELQDLNERIQQFQTNAQQDLQKQQTQLFQPIQEKAKKNIDEVARENGFTYIFDSQAIIYASDSSEDILPLVKKKMGLK